MVNVFKVFAVLSFISFSHSAVHSSFSLFLCFCFSLVIEFFALGQSDFHLYPRPLQINRKGDQGKSVLLDLSQQPHDLPLMHQKPAGSAGIRIKPVAVIIGGDVHLVYQKFSVLNTAPSIFQI